MRTKVCLASALLGLATGAAAGGEALLAAADPAGALPASSPAPASASAGSPDTDGPTTWLEARGDRTATANAYGLQEGMNLLLVGWFPVRELMDWSDPPMDANFDTATIGGCQFRSAGGGADLGEAFARARWPGRIAAKHCYTAYRADGWLWADEAGTYQFRIADADDGGRLTIAGHELRRGGGEAAKVLSVALRAGFHRLRLDGFNVTGGVGLVSEWKGPGRTAFSEIPAAAVFRGPALGEDPGIFQAAVAGVPHDYALSAEGGRRPYRFATVRGALPPGLRLSADGRLTGTPAAAGFHRFTVRLTDAGGVMLDEPLGLRVLPEQGRRSRNDAEVFQLCFDDTDPKTLRGGFLFGRGVNEGLMTVGELSVFPYFPSAPGHDRKIDVVEGEGAFGSKRHALITGVHSHGWYLANRQTDILSDTMPAFRRANRYGVAARFPRRATAVVRGREVSCDWAKDPKTYFAHVLGGGDSFHMAGHNVTRYRGHAKEQMNWHFYHLNNHYWPDHWKPSGFQYLGNGWWYYETSNQPSNQRQGTVDLAGIYDPTQDAGVSYFESLNRFYTVAGGGWGSPTYTHSDLSFGIDQLRIFREEPGLAVRHSRSARVARTAVGAGAESVDIPFLVEHSHPRPCRYWVCTYAGRVPRWDGKGVFHDANNNGAIDPGEKELGLETPELAAGQTARFVYRADVRRVRVGQTIIAGVNLRAHDPDDPRGLRGDGMMILIHKADDPAKVPVESLTALHALQRRSAADWRYAADGTVRRLLPPAVQINGPARRSAKVGEELVFAGTASDPDGPQQPLACWDFGDDSEYQYDERVRHAYSRPGRYTVRLLATDSIMQCSASIVVVIEP